MRYRAGRPGADAPLAESAREVEPDDPKAEYARQAQAVLGPSSGGSPISGGRASPLDRLTRSHPHRGQRTSVSVLVWCQRVISTGAPAGRLSWEQRGQVANP